MNAAHALMHSLKRGEALLVTSDVNRRYLSGFDSSAGAVLITQEAALLFLDFRYREMGELALQKGTIPACFSLRDAYTASAIKAECEAAKISTLYFEDLRMTCAEKSTLESALPSVELLPAGDRVERARICKTPEELARIRAAQAVTEEAFLHVLSCFSPTATDTALAAEIDCYFRRHGAENAFETILVSGKRTSLPHGKPEGEILTPNGFVTMDFGAKVDGYCSDMTRTVAVGSVTDEMRTVYETVLKAQMAAIEKAQAGMTGEEVDRIARDVITQAGYGDCFGHGFGHGLGLDVHEAPTAGPSGKTPMPAGAVISAEPGIYLEGRFGVRIEDVIILREGGCEDIMRAPKELMIL